MTEFPIERRDVLKAAGAGALAFGASQHSLASASETARTTDRDASGTADTAEIADWHDLDALRDDPDGLAQLVSELDEATPGYDEHIGTPDEGWDPIDSYAGTFDGNGYEIADLLINRPDADDVGLFGRNDGTIKNVVLTEAAVTGHSWVGSLAGNNDGKVMDSSASGAVTSTSSFRSRAGGLVGTNTGEVVESAASVAVTGDNWVGGLVGHNFGQVTCSSASGEATGDFAVGGLVGNNDGGEVMGSSASNTVTGNSSVGGLVGKNGDGFSGSEVAKSSASGHVSGNSNVGGLIGDNRGKVVESSSSAAVTGDEEVGGLVGQNGTQHLDGPVVSSSASGDVSGDEEIGGLVGRNMGAVERSAASGESSGEEKVGGLVGWNLSGEVTESAASTAVSGDEQVGGLVGWHADGFGLEGVIVESFATGDVDGFSAVGGAVGENTATVTDTYWDLEATGRPNGIGSGDGGLVTGLTTDEMQGEVATENMPSLDFAETWLVQADPDDYPMLRWQAEPTALFTFVPLEPTAGEVVTFDASCSTGDIVTYRWDFTGDGEFDVTTDDSEAIHVYEEAGAYEATLEVEIEAGLVDTNTETVTVNEELSGTVTGTVTDEDETPLEGIEVEFLDASSETAVASVVTDEEGTYEVELAVGDYEAVVEELGFDPFGEPVTVEADEETVLDIELQSLDSGTVIGTVTDTDGNPLDGVEIIGFFESDPVETTTTDDTGDYELSLPPATYTVEAFIKGYQRGIASVSLGENDTVEQDFELAEGPPALPGQDDPPHDLTGDGRFEDIDGDGEFTIFDVQALFNGLDSDAVQNHPEAFNFNDDEDPEDVTIFDVQGLFSRLQDWAE